MKDALYQMEENLEAPLASNPGISRYYELVADAERRIPANLMADNHRWRLHMQRAALDKYLQDKVRQELDRQKHIQEAARTAADGKKPGQVLRDIHAMLAEPKETEEMKGLRTRREGWGRRATGFSACGMSAIFHWTTRCELLPNSPA